MIGRGASPARDKSLTMAPLERFSSGKNALVTLSKPRKLTAKVCSVTSSVRGVTRSSGCCRAPRVPAYTFFAPRRSASSRRARPIPRLAPVIKTDLFEIFMTFSFVDSPFEFRISKTQAENPFPLLHLVGLREDAHQHLPFCGIACDSC